MTVRELIGELLDCDMDAEVVMKIKLMDTDLEYEEVGVEIIKTGGGWGRNTPYITIDLEDTPSQKFAEGLMD